MKLSETTYESKYHFLFEEVFAREQESDCRIELKEGWLHKIEKFRGCYVRFIFAWMKYTEKLLHSAGEVPWGCIEGYHILVTSFLQKMKETDIQIYTPNMSRAIISMLANEKMIFPVIHTQFLKTKYFCEFILINLVLSK